MSEQTRAALEAAIATHVADECDGDVAQGYVLVVENTDLEQHENGRGGMYIESGRTSTFTVTGLLHSALYADTAYRDEDD